VAPPALRPSERAPRLLLGDGVSLPDDAEIGGNVVIHSGTTVGSGAQIQDGAILGKPLALGAHSRASRDPLSPLVVGAGARICAGAIVLAGSTIGPRAMVGDRAHVRERVTIGEETTIGTASAVDNDVEVGARVRVQTACYLVAFSRVEDDVFVAPGVITTNDQAAGRGGELEGVVLRRACRIGGGAILLPGVEVGEEAFVGAGALVTKDVPARTVVVGSPARARRQVSEEELLEAPR
jgi:UDP-2-acetamido-3-amino-2,3-dideoxy-glucuronate N-acetyltransferase